MELAVGARIGLDGQDGRDGADGEDGKNGQDGSDGVSIINAEIAPAGNLQVFLSNDVVINAGHTVGKTGLTGLATFDTEPIPSTETQLYIASGAGTYEYFLNENGNPIEINTSNAIVTFFKAAGSSHWTYTLLEIDLTEYMRKEAPLYFSTVLPRHSFFSISSVMQDCYDPATGIFNLPEGINNVTCPDNAYGKIVYKDCTHVMLGRNSNYGVYLEVSTGEKMMLHRSGTITYSASPVSETPITGRYVRVNNHQAGSTVVDVEQSNDGVNYSYYSTVDRLLESTSINSPERIATASVGFYHTGATVPKILSLGQGNRLMFDDVAEDQRPLDGDTFEVLVPSNNLSGFAKRTISLADLVSRIAELL